MVSNSDDLQWYKDAIIYELHVRAFRDSDGDGIGDFRGLTEKLEYLQQLGVTAIWLLPFYPSPGRDDGYDIADYRKINPSYGTMRDFRAFMREADRLGLRVITELPINHTSDQHEWFQKARRAAAGSAARNFYVWSETPDKYTEARIIFQDFEASNWTWDPVAKEYFWHRFYSHQPDLNFDNPAVRRAVISVLNYWMRMGVSGMRLDAIPYLYEREGTNCENLEETHEFLRTLRKHVDTQFPGRMLLSEANQWPEQAAAYFGDNERGESHMAFHFPLMPRLFMAVQLADSTPIIDILEQTPETPDASQWAIFLRNHDELTLEMVTDEERDYMYRMYAHDRQMRVNLGIRRRLASLMNNDRRKIELMHALLFSLPGTPVLYYGDEIGMGDNFYLGDRNSVRTPMQWSSDRNAGFSSANSQQLYLPIVVDPEYHYEAVNVEAQLRNPDSLLWWMKRIIVLRKSHTAFSRGSLRFLHTSTSKAIAFVRTHGDDEVLVVVNLSRYPQHVTIEAEDMVGRLPVEMFGSVDFPIIEDRPYTLSIGPYGFYWFTLQPATEEHEREAQPETPVPSVTVRPGAWSTLFDDGIPAELTPVIRKYFNSARWFGGKSRTVQSMTLRNSVPVNIRSGTIHALFIDLRYTEGEPETYFLPVAMKSETDSGDKQDSPHGVICRLQIGSGSSAVSGLLCDALEGPEFPAAMLSAIGARRGYAGKSGVELVASPAAGFRTLRQGVDTSAAPKRFAVEQSNTSILIDNKLIFKFYRRVSPGVNPDYEIGKFLTEQTKFENASPVAGTVELSTGRRGQTSTVAILQKFVEAQGDAWQFSLDTLRGYGERWDALSDQERPAKPQGHIIELAKTEPPEEAAYIIGPYLESARLLGERTAQLHKALATSESADFAPEPFTSLYQRSLYQGMRNSVRAGLRSLRTISRNLPQESQQHVEELLRREQDISSSIGSLLDHRMSAQRIRIHGDYHLGQVLYTGTDFIIIDFEGEPSRPLTERRLKQSPLRDVAGMIRSFDYAASVALLNDVDETAQRERRMDGGRVWSGWVSAAFLNGYRTEMDGNPLVPQDEADFRTLLNSFLLQKAVYEVQYELNNRPQWASIPVRGLLSILGAS